MKAMSGGNLVRRLGFARLLPSALLLMSIACSLVTGGAGGLAAEKGLKNPPGRDEETKKYFKERVHFSRFDPNVRGHFKSGDTTIQIKVKPEKTTHNRSWHQAILSSIGDGMIVARIENVDHQAAPALGLTASDDYAYIWIGQLPSGKRGISFYTFDDDGYALKKGTLDLDSFRFCTDYTGNKPDATFGKNHPDDSGLCEYAPVVAPMRANASAQLTSYSPKPTRSVWPGGLWISCSGGCCDVGGAAFY